MSRRRWRSFLGAFACVMTAAAFVLLGVLVLIDPYDTGRLALFDRPGVAPQGPRTANASRGRDPAFDSAIIGNSRIQLLEPGRLSAATGLDFMSLTVPGTRPTEQFVVLDWFLRHHPSPGALVVGLDRYWCLEQIEDVEPFPFWLYDRSLVAYLGGLFRYSALEDVPGRLAVLLGRGERARPDGYWDYEREYRRPGMLDTQAEQRHFTGERPTSSFNRSGAFPAAERLKAVLAELPASIIVVLARPPTHVSALPAPGSPAEEDDAKCRERFAAIARARPRTVLVDWAVDRPENRSADNYFDQTHYRRAIADALGADIAAAVEAARNGRTALSFRL